MFVVAGLTILYIAAAENNDTNSFVKNLDSYKNACRELGWEPKCKRKNLTSKIDKFSETCLLQDVACLIDRLFWGLIQAGCHG